MDANQSLNWKQRIRSNLEIDLKVNVVMAVLYLALSASLFAQSSLQLPDAPSSTPKEVVKDTYCANHGRGEGKATVNGCAYEPPSSKLKFKAYRQDMISYRPFLSAAFRSGVEQYRERPTGWGKDAPGYAQRFGSAYGEAAIVTTTRYAMAAALHEDARYLLCHHCSMREKLKNAILSEFTEHKGPEGRRVFSPTPIVANFSGPMVAYAAWYPPGYGPDDAARHSALGFGTRMGSRLLRELIFDRDK